MGFPRQEYWSVLLFPSPENLPHPRIKSKFPALQADSLPLSQQGYVYPFPLDLPSPPPCHPSRSSQSKGKNFRLIHKQKPEDCGTIFTHIEKKELWSKNSIPNEGNYHLSGHLWTHKVPVSIPPTFYMQGQKLERKIKITAATSLLPIHHIYFFFVCVPGVIKAGMGVERKSERLWKPLYEM